MADTVTIPAAGTGDTTPKVYALDYGTEGKKQVMQANTGLNPSSSFTRPANTTAYSTGQLVANDTVAANVVPLSWVCSDSNAATLSKATFKIVRIRLKKSTNAVGAGTFTMWFFGTDPTAASGLSVGDGGTLAGNVKDAVFLGTSSFASNNFIGSDCAYSMSTPTSAGTGGIIVVPASGTVYGFILASAPYTPGSSEVFTVTLEVIQD